MDASVNYTWQESGNYALIQVTCLPGEFMVQARVVQLVACDQLILSLQALASLSHCQAAGREPGVSVRPVWQEPELHLLPAGDSWCSLRGLPRQGVACTVISPRDMCQHYKEPSHAQVGQHWFKKA